MFFAFSFIFWFPGAYLPKQKTNQASLEEEKEEMTDMSGVATSDYLGNTRQAGFIA
jgi:hypothetical protein